MQKISEAHVVLYNCMKNLHDNDLQFTKDMMLAIYNGHVQPEKRAEDYQKGLSEEQVYQNASAWLNGAISKLVRRGYLGLTFNNGVEENSFFTKEAATCQII